MWEASLLSITPAFSEIKFQENTLFGKRLKSFKDNIDRPLSAILTLNTIAHTVGAIGVGAAATRSFPNNELITSIIVPVTMTLLILILSEIIPKTIGANYWQNLANFTVTSLHWMILALYPLVWLSQLITKYLKKDKSKSILSRADFLAMAQIGAKTGSLRKDETKIIQNLLRFNTVLAKNIMTPRTVVKAANEESSILEFYNDNNNLRFSRIPIYEKVKDKITGFVLKDEVLSSIINKKGELPLKELGRKILIVNESMAIPDLFEKLMGSREHIALVVDEFGGTAGIVTMEDVIETLLGMEIMDEFDNIEDMQRLARKNWEKRAKDLGILSKEEEEKEEGLDKTINVDDKSTNSK
jgi:CBS domain containing-hemolysin-like protein